MPQITQIIADIGLVPVVALEEPDLAVPLANSLAEGGIPIIEITYRTAGATRAIRNITKEDPEILVGAGTVLTLDQAKAAQDAGIRFLVTPGFSSAIVNFCLDAKIPIFPGVATPTEVTQALEKGLEVLKFFPADAFGGPATLKALGGPFRSIRFIPTGGINPDNLAEYLALPQVLACGGSWLARKATLQARDFAGITRTARSALEIVRKIRGDSQTAKET